MRGLSVLEVKLRLEEDVLAPVSELFLEPS